jgi:SAM-dependent methyltransferase
MGSQKPGGSYVTNFTDYMAIVAEHFGARKAPLKILDVPAGAGSLAQALRDAGHEVVCADINRERPDYVYADLAQALPFDDGAFDAVICLEGLEHLREPARLIGELVRVTAPGGEIVLSTPNLMNFYSRLHQLLTGAPYQFNPALITPLPPEAVADRGHISPLSYFQLRRTFEDHGVRVEAVRGDRFKRLVLAPLYLALLPLVALASWVTLIQGGDPRHRSRNGEMLRHALSPPLLLSRSLVLFLSKPPAQT